MVMTNGDSPRTVALLNQKGGVGKTTTTANLGHALAIAGKRVCLIDLDPQGHLTLHLGIDQDAVDRTVYDLMVDPDCDVADCVIRDARPNLDVMLAEVDLAAAENELASLAERRTILRDRFAPIADRYDVVLIDCPPSLGLLTVNALTMADELFVPMQAHFLALQGVGRLLETVRLVCGSVNAELTVAGVILCMFERQTTLAKEILVDLEEFFDSYRGADVPWSECRVLQPPIRRNIKLAEAPSFGNTIFDYAPWCPGAIDYRRLAAALLERWGQAVEGFAPAEADDDEPAVAVAAEPEVGSRAMSVGPGSRGVTSVAPPPAPDSPAETESEAEARPEPEAEIRGDAPADAPFEVAADPGPTSAPDAGSDDARAPDVAVEQHDVVASPPAAGLGPLDVADPLRMGASPGPTVDFGTSMPTPSSPASDAPVVEIQRTTPSVDEAADRAAIAAAPGSSADEPTSDSDETTGAAPRDAAASASP